jgi:hypothetical protein
VHQQDVREIGDLTGGEHRDAPIVPDHVRAARQFDGGRARPSKLLEGRSKRCLFGRHLNSAHGRVAITACGRELR